MDTPVGILLVEDEPLWQVGVETLLSTDDRFQLTGVADNFEQALARFHETRPQMALLDWKIKGSKDGLEVGEQLLKEGLRPEHIVIISGSDPGMIPAHPFLFVPKSRISHELLPLLSSLLDSVTIC